MITDDFKFQVKAASEARVLALGGRICDWLPILDAPAVRALEEVKGRMSVLNALINISFEAPIAVIAGWLQKHDLHIFLSEEEEQILTKTNEDLTKQEIGQLRWNLESLWALLWAAGLIEELDPSEWCGDNMMELLPNLEKGEDNGKIAQVSALRPPEELYRMLDYYYRLHWYCVDERLQGREALVNEGIIYERRKALEWVFNRAADWDEVEMST